MNRHFTEESTQMANKHMKRCPTLFVITEMQIETVQGITINLPEWLK